VHRYHPALVAQALVTLERLAPGRAFLGLGSGESLNESPLGMDWPPPAEQLERLDEAVDIIDRLLDGETVTRDGPYFRLKEAVLHTRPRRRPPLYISAFHPGAAELAARRGDGVWTAADPEVAGPVLRAYGEACREAGRAPGEVLMHLHVAWDHDDDAAFGGARVWKATLVPEFFTDDRHDPAGMQEQAAREVSDDELRRVAVISSDPDAHVRHIRAVQEMGATIVVLMNVSGSNPLGTIRTYGERVLPVLRHEPIMVGGRP
jgi:coenzyme F420-dependent glucose-6-phosphate dehydrogenase